VKSGATATDRHYMSVSDASLCTLPSLSCTSPDMQGAYVCVPTIVSVLSKEPLSQMFLLFCLFCCWFSCRYHSDEQRYML